MEILKIIPFIISFTLLLNQTTHAATNTCQPQFCGKNKLVIRFPFQIQNQQSSSSPNCGYPNFNLICNITNKPELTLTLPHSGDFLVRDINYATQEVVLYDQNNCLPRRFMNLSMSSSPFTITYTQNFTFLSCPPEFVTRSGFSKVDCLSNSTASILATLSMNLVRALNVCSVVDTYVIPLSWPQGDEWLVDQLNQDLLLTWNVPNCVDCEASGGICEFKNVSTQTFCFKAPGKGNTPPIQIFKIIALAIVIPAVTCSLCISCFICFVERRNNRGSPNSATIEAIEIPTHSTISGLDDSTIESYEKVVLGDSRRLPGPNGATCPICLVDYDANDTVRCIPLCEHCFHSECIDEWLRMNATCPVCRNSPSPARAYT